MPPSMTYLFTEGGNAFKKSFNPTLSKSHFYLTYMGLTESHETQCSEQIMKNFNGTSLDYCSLSFSPYFFNWTRLPYLFYQVIRHEILRMNYMNLDMNSAWSRSSFTRKIEQRKPDLTGRQLRILLKTIAVLS